MAWVSELEYFDDLFRSETQELDVLEEEGTKNRVSDGTNYPFLSDPGPIIVYACQALTD